MPEALLLTRRTSSFLFRAALRAPFCPSPGLWADPMNPTLTSAELKSILLEGSSLEGFDCKQAPRRQEAECALSWKEGESHAVYDHMSSCVLALRLDAA